MGNTVTKSNDNHKINKLQKQKDLTNEQQITTTITTVGDQQTIFKNQQHQTNDRKLFDKLKQKHQSEEILVIKTKTSTAENTAAANRSNSTKATVTQQKQKQNSTWSLASLSTRFNWSFSGSNTAVRHSFRQRSKSTRKSLTSLQQLRRSKTTWHKPTTNAIFISHFKESSSQFNKQQFQIVQLVAKGAFGIVFKVSDKHQQQIQIIKQEKDNEIATASNLITTTPTSTLKAVTAAAATKTTPIDQQYTFYALKVLKKSKILAENGVQQIKDEADVQKLCGHHPFIVQQFDLWQNRHNLHILSEFVPNGELFSKIANFTLDLIRLYTAEIALAIDFLHNAGIIYRDAKPENILLTHNFHIKLTDFGLSKWLKLGMTTRTMCGTFQYMGTN